MFNNKEVEKIVVTRPAISKEKLGFMPGDLAEKMAPYMEPIKQCMYKAYEKRIGGKDKIDKHFQNNEFQILPIAFTRGVTYMDSVVIVDEFQNLELSEFKLVLTRLGKRSKLILTGAEDQIDLRFPEMSCVHHINKLQDIPGLKIFKLYENHRHPILDLIDKIL
jgi:phosphate starvation-inducible PhoH-like protein